jgi:hypothetical protein
LIEHPAHYLHQLPEHSDELTTTNARVVLS